MYLGIRPRERQEQQHRFKCRWNLPVLAGLLGASLAFATSAGAQLPPLRPPPPAKELPPEKINAPQVDEKAANFSLPDKSGIPVELSKLLKTPVEDETASQGRWVLLVFYRGYWCPLCNADLRSLQEHLPEFATRGVRIVAVSADPPDVTRKHVDKLGYSFLFLSDTQTQVIRRYGLLREGEGSRPADVARPAQFLVDSSGTIRWVNLTKDHQVRLRPEQLLEVIDALTPAPASAPQ